jgi:hypothetical protein
MLGVTEQVEPEVTEEALYHWSWTLPLTPSLTYSLYHVASETAFQVKEGLVSAMLPEGEIRVVA